MTSLVAIGAAAIVVVALVIVGLKMARKGGKHEGASDEKAGRLAESAARRARADAIAAMPPPSRDRLSAAWHRYRRLRGVPEEDPEGGGPASTMPPAE